MFPPLKHTLFITSLLTIGLQASDIVLTSQEFPLMDLFEQTIPDTDHWGKYQSTKDIQDLLKAAESGNKAAQVLLIDSYMLDRPGFKVTQHNAKILLAQLTNFAVDNPAIRPLLIEAYKDGHFGINPEKRKTAKIGKKLALEYVKSPGIGDLIVKAMKEERLGFKSRRSYLNRYKDKKTGKWRTIKNNPDLPLIEYLAFDLNNQSAQTFLLECYMNNKYGADSSDRKTYRELLIKLDTLADSNQDLADLITQVWQDNRLKIKDKEQLNQERFRITQHFPSSTEEHPDGNRFSALTDLTD